MAGEDSGAAKEGGNTSEEPAASMDSFADSSARCAKACTRIGDALRMPTFKCSAVEAEWNAASTDGGSACGDNDACDA